MKKIIAPFLLCVAAASFSVPASASSMSLKPFFGEVSNVKITTFKQSCHANVGKAYFGGANNSFIQPRFLGTAHGTVTHHSNGLKEVQVTGYEIWKFDIKDAGNKANLNIRINEGKESKSSDNLKQTESVGVVNQINLSTSAMNGRYATFKFIFDKKGSDPSCSVSISL